MADKKKTLRNSPRVPRPRPARGRAGGCAGGGPGPAPPAYWVWDGSGICHAHIKEDWVKVKHGLCEYLDSKSGLLSKMVYFQ